MGKHDKHSETSHEEFMQNLVEKLKKANKELTKELEFANETIKNLQEQCGRMSKWASEIEANAQDKLAEKDSKIKTLEKAMSRMAEKIYGV